MITCVPIPDACVFEYKSSQPVFVTLSRARLGTRPQANPWGHLITGCAESCTGAA